MTHLLVLVLALPGQEPDSVPPADSVEIQMENVAYASDSLVFYPSSRNIVLVGASRIDYRDMTLEADTVVYDAAAGSVEASGSPELIDRGESITGSRMYYSLSTRRGRIDAPDSRYEFGYYTGTTVTQVGRREFNITDARFTTCSEDSSHYYFYSPQMKVFQNDRAVARPVYMYVEDTPVFFFPWWVFPIRTGRQSGFTIPKFGQTSRDGRYLRDLGYYFAFSDYMDLLVSGDIMDKSRVALSARERHVLRYVHHGSAEVEWRREFQTGLDRWRLFGEHLHDFPDGSSVRLRGEILSDRSYLKETQQTPEARMNNEIRSWANFSRPLGRAAFQLTLDRTAYLGTDPDSIPDETESVQSLPDARLTLPSAPLFGAPADPSRRRPWHSLYWNLSAHYLSTDTRREDTRETHSGLRAQSDVTGSWRPWDVLSVSPRITGTATAYDRDRLGGRYPWWLAGSAGISTSTDVYGTFSTVLFGFSALRHTITPSVTLGWVPDTYLAYGDGGLAPAPADSADDVYFSFSDFRLPSPGTTLRLGLFQSLEAKRVSGDRVERVELATLELSATADLTDADTVFSPLAARLTLTPGSALGLSADASWNPYSSELEQMDFTTTLRLAGEDQTLVPDSARSSQSGLPLRLSLSHYYRIGLGEESDLSKLRAAATLALSPSWSLQYDAYYDVLEGSFVSQSYTLRRDLHCWEAMFVRHVSDVDAGFYFRINIKDLPDIKIEQHVSNF